MRTRGQYYQSPTHSEAGSKEDTVDVPEEHITTTSRDSSGTPKTWGVSTFDIMADDHGGASTSTRDRYSGRAEGIAFADWKTRFKSWQRTQRQRNPVFNDWWAFEQLPSHLEHEALQSYDSWYEEHEEQLLVVELYWTQRVELVTALKEGATIPEARGNVEEGDEAGTSILERPRRETRARPTGSSTTGSFLSRLSHATMEAVATLGDPPPFEPLREFFDYLEVEYGGIRRDRMRHIQDFQREKGDTPRIMYARLARFARETGDAFTERQLVALYMAKQDKHIQQMAHPQLLLTYGGRATLAQAFSLVERLDQGLCVEEAGKLPSVMTATSGRSNTGTTGSRANQDKGQRGKGQNPQGGQKQLASAMSAEEDAPPTSNVKCWGCGEEGHTKRECPLKVSPGPPPVPRGGQGGGRGGRGGSGGRGQGRPNAPPIPPYGQGNGTNIKCAYPPCGKPGHTEAQCWMKYPHLRPQPFVPRGNQGGGSSSGGNMEARLAELQDTLARLVAASA